MLRMNVQKITDLTNAIDYQQIKRIQDVEYVAIDWTSVLQKLLSRKANYCYFAKRQKMYWMFVLNLLRKL